MSLERTAISQVSGVQVQGNLTGTPISEGLDFSYPASNLEQQGLQATILAESRAALLTEAGQLVTRCTEAVPPAERELALMLHQLRLARLGNSREQATIFTAYHQLYPQGWLRYLVVEAVADWLAERGEYSAFSARSLLVWMQQQWPQTRVLTMTRYEQSVSTTLVELAEAGKVQLVNVGNNFTQMYTAG